MRLSAKILLPAAVTAMTLCAVLGVRPGVSHSYSFSQAPSEMSDTVIYPQGAYKLKRVGDFGDEKLADSLLVDNYTPVDTNAVLDTLPHLTARDTIKAPDSLRFTDPFRYKYYVALIDSLTHVQVRDSLKHSSDSLKQSADSLQKSFKELLQQSLLEKAREDSTHAWADSLQARLDSLDWRKIDSIYLADSTAIAKAAFQKWYNSLSRRDRKKYDAEQLLPIKLHEMDSIRKVKEEKQAKKDSITKFKPRVLDTFALPDSLHYKRIVTWTTDQDFHKLSPEIPDTTFNYHYYDYPFLRKDVNATWLGVAGSPVLTYNWFLRESREGVEFYDAQESWAWCPSTVPHYNSKTAHTELAYFGTLLGSDAKESDNLHILTTQNITPELNFNLMFDRFGGGGMLENETTRNKNFVANVNYLAKNYMAHGGYIYNMVGRGENGGVQDNFWVRDTTLNDSREIDVNLKNAKSEMRKNTWYLDQQYRIPFNFIYKIKARRDSTFTFDADSLQENITTAFIGHSSEYSTYARTYTDKINVNEKAARAFFNNDFYWNPTQSADTMGVTKLDNKIFLRLQPWSEDAIVSKLNVGIGDLMKHYFDSTSLRPTKHKENSVYIYAGAEGRYLNFFNWDAKGKYVLLGTDFGDFKLEANAQMQFFPFRKARTSPVQFGAHFETSLLEPTYYQKHFYSNHYHWDNDLSKISTTKLEGRINIPYWKASAMVGYALLGNNMYYDTLGIARQNTKAMSVLTASLRKEFVAGPVHFDNKALLQFSSNPEVLPLPTLALNLRWYAQFVVQRYPDKIHNVMEMQVGINAFYNTQWFAPAWNPVLGVFHNQNKCLYENGPYFDIFLNIQWKRACLFIKYQNFGTGWPMESKDYFTAHNYIGTQDGGDGLKIGIFWPFWPSTTKHTTVSK